MALPRAGETLPLVEEALCDAFVGVNAAVAQEGPVLTGDLDQLGIEVGDEDLFLVVAGLGDDAAEGVGDEAASPELEAGLRVWSPGPWSSSVAGLPSAAMTLNFTSPCSWPTRLTAQAKTPLAMAWAR